MASFDVKMPTEYLAKLRKVTNQIKPICEKTVIAGAAPIADKIRSNAEKILSSEATGEMLKSFGITPPGMDDRGVINVKVGFGNYDRNGTPNALKANALESGRVMSKEGEKRSHKKRTAEQWARAIESGTSVQPKRPFIRPAVRATKEASFEAMTKTLNEEIEKIMK